MRTIVKLFFVLCIFHFALANRAWSQAQVISLVGKALVSPTETAPGRPLVFGENLAIGSLVTTKDDGKVKLILPDKTIVTVGPVSTLKIAKFVFEEKSETREGKLNLLLGKVRVLVPKLEKIYKTKFEVETPNSIAGVRGTYFYVSVERNGSSFNTGVYALGGGNVYVQGTGSEVNLAPGSFITTELANSGAGPGAIPPQVMDQIDQTTHVEEGIAPEIEQREIKGLVEAPPPWVDQGVAYNQSNGNFDQFRGNQNNPFVPNNTGMLIPPIRLEPNRPGQGSATSISITVGGLPQ